MFSPIGRPYFSRMQRTLYFSLSAARCCTSPQLEGGSAVCLVKPASTSGPKWPVNYSPLISAVINNAGAAVNDPHDEPGTTRTCGSCHSFFT